MAIPDIESARDSNPQKTLHFIKAILTTSFPGHSTGFVSSVCEQVQKLFTGKYPGYQACDTAYHNFSHACQATMATARILDGQIRSSLPPVLTARDIELGIAAVLLHDAGYLKEQGDAQGTGAKHAATHVDRGARLAAVFLPAFGVTADEILLVQSAIYCTAPDVDPAQLQLHGDRQRFIGYAVGSGDILSQMAASDYPDRLTALYDEFKEAATTFPLRQKGTAHYTSVEDLLRKTRSFYQQHVRRALDVQLGGAYKMLAYHFPDGRTHYLEAIEANLDRIDEILATAR